MWFWFRVKMCWFLTVVSTVRNTVWHSFWNVIVCQNISVNVVTTASDMTMLLTALYATTMYSLSSQMMRTTTVSMRMNTLLDQGKLHWPCCWQGRLLSTLTFKYVWLSFFFFSCVAPSIGLVIWAVYNIWAVLSHLCVMLKTSSFGEIKKASLVISIEINQINSTLNFELCTIPQTHEAPQPFVTWFHPSGFWCWQGLWRSSCVQLRFSHLRLH